MMKAFLTRNGHHDPKQADRNYSRQLAQSPQVLICPPPLLRHHPMVTSLVDQREVIIRPMKDGNGKRKFELGTIFTISCHPWDSNAKVRPNQPNPPQQHSPLPSLPCKQAPWQPTADLSGTQWLDDLFRGNQPRFHLISTFYSSELTVPPFVEPSQTKKPPIPGPIPYSKPHVHVPTCEPEPDVAPTKSMEEPFGKSQLFLTFPSTISSSSHSTPLRHHHQQYAYWILPPSAPKNPTASSPHSHNEACQEVTDL
ncbi:hypothetical protein O181_050238 [Austropuccinia psidii MF-1]|uniref:Uncharacterized protein n=1 Tax=Austropuccinia psidii MF-1 TaxID=1389203 RepID=A0A9Q3E1D7_9BASI|nr:hypothetical protein [Austropuccinia psidii MF-1]